MATVTVVTGITIERQLLRVPAAWLIADRYCANADDDCCGTAGEGTVTTDCCPDNPINKTLYAVLIGPEGFEYITGVYPLIYSYDGITFSHEWTYASDATANAVTFIQLVCIGGSWNITINGWNTCPDPIELISAYADVEGPFFGLSVVCSPFSAEGSAEFATPVVDPCGELEGKTVSFQIVA